MYKYVWRYVIGLLACSSLVIVLLSQQNVLAESLADAEYTNDSFSFLGFDSGPSEVVFSTDGTKMYMVGVVFDDVHQFNLSTPWDVTTAGDGSTLSLDAYAIADTESLYISHDGLQVFVLEGTGTLLMFDINPGSPWDLLTATFNTSTNIAPLITDGVLDTAAGITFGSEGAYAYVVGFESGAVPVVKMFTLDGAYNFLDTPISSSTFTYTQGSLPMGIALSSDGGKMYIVDYSNEVHEYVLGTPWDIGTASFTSSFSTENEGNNTRGITFSSDDRHMYVTIDSTDSVHDYVLTPLFEGSGIDIDDPYIITTCTQLQEMRQDLEAYYKLDPEEGYIDCSESDSFNGGLGFEPIGNDSANDDPSRFTGSLDGNEIIIYNLDISDTSGSPNGVGLFGAIGTTGEVSRVGLVGGLVNAEGDNVGALVGINYGSISYSFADVDVSSIGSFVGGLVGMNSGYLINSYANGDVNGDGYVGGFAGATVVDITDSYASGAVSGSVSGGFVGRLTGGATLRNVLSASTVSGPIKGGLVGGLVDEFSGWVVNGYWGSTVNPQDDCIIVEAGGVSNIGCTDVGATTTLLYDIESEPYISFWDGTGHLIGYEDRTPTFSWHDPEFLPGVLQGSGTSVDPYQITECLLIIDPGYYVLMNDITAPVDENCIQIATSSVFVDGDDRTIFGSSEEMSGVITVEGGPYENVHIHDVTVTDFLSGFALFDVTSATIERVESVSAGAYGIYLEQSTSTVITSSTITSAGEDGIKIFEDNNGVTITSSTISGSEVGNGIQVELSNNVTISGNTIFDILGGAGGDGIDVEGVDTLVISNNTISTTTGYGIVIDSFDPDEGDSVENSSIIIATNTISATYEDGMNINYSTTVVISGNTVNGLGEIGQGEDGIDVDNCTNVVVENNIVVDIYDDSYEFEDGINVYINGNTATSTYNGNGIEMEDMSSSTMSMNTFSNLDTDGIYIEDSQNIRITTNTFNNIGQNGIDLDDDGPGNDLVYITYNSFTDIGDQGLEVDDTTNLTIQLNQFSNIGLAEGGSGMNIDDSSNLIITSNTMSNIGRSGMFVEYVDGITIEENTISEYGVNDTFGEITVAGIQLYAASAFDVNNNYIDTDSEYNPAGIYVLEEYETTTNSTITNNIVTTTGRAFYIEETTEAISILGNSMYSDFWVYTATTTNVVFNDEDSGNTYYLGNGTPSWEQFDITDSNGDGWADNGAALPFGVATLGEDLWVGSVVDEHPATLVAYTAPRRSGGGGATIQISRPTPSNNTTATSGSLVLNNNDKETTNRSVRALLFVNNATEMAISNRADFSQSSYMPFSSSFTHTLTPGNGKKTVFIKLRSSDGGTLTISDEIMLTGQVTDAVEDESTSDDEVMIGAEDQPIITPKGPDITIPTNGLQCSTNLVLTTPVRFGLNNNINDVKLLEQFLNTYEGTNLPVNGIYETADFNAVVKWQEKYAADILTPWGLTKGTGYVFTTSLKKIKEIHEKNCATATPVAPSQPAAPISASCLNTQTTLTSGMSGPLVTTAQTLLQKLKLFSATPTGFYGPVTTASVRAFQSANGIDALGIIGPATRAKLNELGC